MADLTVVQVNSGQTTIITQSSGTINLLNLSNISPVDIGRTAVVGTSNLAARADHTHSAASLLLDGGSY